MKTLRYLLIAMVIGLASVSMHAQVKKSEKVEYKFHSTSTQVNSSSTSSVCGNRTTSTLMGDGSISPLMHSGSRLPIAARNGVIVGSTSPDDNTSNGGVGHHGNTRRGKMDDDPFGGETIGDVNNPQEPGTPIGDGMWVLMMLAMGYAFGKLRRRWHFVP